MSQLFNFHAIKKNEHCKVGSGWEKLPSIVTNFIKKKTKLEQK